MISQYREKVSVPANVLSFAHPIWVMWWQGEAQMPPIIQRTYQSLKDNANGHPICFISKDTYNKYIDFPAHIMERLQCGQMNLTHFSDVMRITLLSEYGGLWIDATFWVTQPIDINGYGFYSLKQNTATNMESGCRWIVGLIGGDKSFQLFAFIRDCLFYYWKNNEVSVHYFLLDFLLSIAYDEFPAYRQIIDDMPYRCPQLHIMKQLFNETLPKSDAKLKQILHDNPFLSTTWKRSFKTQTSSGALTYFGFFMGEKNKLNVL